MNCQGGRESAMGFLPDERELKKYISGGRFGLEKESLRVDQQGYLSHTPHPFPDDCRIDRDFCENQVELITGVNDSIEDVWAELAGLYRETADRLLELETGREYLWPFSNPPYVCGEADIPIANFTGRQEGKGVYREYLASKYGKKKMLYSGIHYNFSFPEDLLRADFAWRGKKKAVNETEKNLVSNDKREKTDSREENRAAGEKDQEFREYKDQIYLELGKKAVKYSWLIVYLTAASPVLDGSYYRVGDLDETVVSRYASPRCSEIGYWNSFVPVLDFSSLDAYADSIDGYVKNRMITASTELYYPVRLKARGENTTDNLRKNGVSHVELRMLDLNPLCPVGIRRQDLRFIHLLLVWLMLQEDEVLGTMEQNIAIRNMKEAARFSPDEIQIEFGWHQSRPVREAAAEVLDAMEETLPEYFVGQEDMVRECLAFQREKVEDSSKRYAAQVRERFQKGYVKKGIRLAEGYCHV
ncbi:MAG: hypothetical protein LUE92_04335 [Clostridiales bacterium]|nr:hypothetical protein [Clostridiales bacterium]